MAKSLTELRTQLSDIEPSDATFAGIATADVEHLLVIMSDEEGWLAERAVYALARIDSASARQALLSATEDPRAEIRVAASVAAAVVPAAQSDQMLLRLLADPHSGVRKFAVRAVSARNSEAVLQRVREISNAYDDARLQRAAEEKISSISGG
jgi:HEAT repeat protein